MIADFRFKVKKSAIAYLVRRILEVLPSRCNPQSAIGTSAMEGGEKMEGIDRKYLRQPAVAGAFYPGNE